MFLIVRLEWRENCVDKAIDYSSYRKALACLSNIVDVRLTCCLYLKSMGTTSEAASNSTIYLKIYLKIYRKIRLEIYMVTFA